MTPEIAYPLGLLTGGTLAGLIALFLHAKVWVEWREATDLVRHERDALAVELAGVTAMRDAAAAEWDDAEERINKFVGLLADARTDAAGLAGERDAMRANYKNEAARADDTGRHRDSLHAELMLAAKALVALTGERDAEVARVGRLFAERDSWEILRAGLVAAEVAMGGRRDEAVRERDALAGQLADTHKSLDAAMQHVEQLVMKRDAAIAERDQDAADYDALSDSFQAECRTVSAYRVGLADLARKVETVRDGAGS